MIPLLVNPAAGGGRASRLAQRAALHCRQRGIEVEIRVAARPGDIERLARQLATEHTELVFVSGGDGTLHEAVRALGGTSTALGILPAGRGNDLAGTLGVPSSVEAAVDFAFARSPGPIDLGMVNGTRFATTVAIGFDADVALRTRSGIWSHGGRLAYIGCALSRLFVFPAAELVISGDFGRREGRFLLCAVSNTGRYGGGVMIAPGSSVYDGQLDVCLVRDLPRLKALAVLPRVFQGKHIDLKEVELVRTTTLQVQSPQPLPAIADGEPVGNTPLLLQVDPGALLVAGSGSERFT